MNSMKIDIFPHILPKKYYDLLVKRGSAPKRAQATPALHDIDTRLRMMDDFPDYVQVLTLSGPPLERLGNPNETPELARLANDEMAELVMKYPDRFLAAVAALPMNNVDASVREIDRAIKQLGFKGVQIYTDANGQALDNPEFLPIFEKMAEYDLPIWLHPARRAKLPDYETEDRSKFQIWFCFGWPYATGAAMTRLIFTGLFDKYPNLKIITHHLGGVVPYFAQRIRGTYDQYEVRLQEGEDDMRPSLRKNPYEYYRMFYADTAVYGFIPAMECAQAFFGTNQILFGTDMPFDAEGGYRYIRDTIQSVEGMTASAEDKRKIYEENARRLLKA